MKLKEVKKYTFIPAKNKRVRGIYLGEADEPTGAKTMNPIEGDIYLEKSYTYLLANAKRKGIPLQRAEILVMTIMNLYSTLVDTKFSQTEEDFINRILKVVYKKFQQK